MIGLTLTRITLGLVLAVAVAAKAADRRGLVEAVRAYSVVPESLVGVAAIGLFVGEGVVATSLLSGRLLSVGLPAAFLLFETLSIASAVALRRKGAIKCGCLGRLAETRLGWWSIGANAVLGVVALVASFSLRLRFADGPELNETPVVWACGILLAVLYWVVAYTHSVTGFVRERLAGAD